MKTPLRVLLPVDGSLHALAAVRHALRLAEGAPTTSFVVVNIQESATLYEVMVAHDAERLTQVRRDAGADLLAPAEALLEAAGAAYESEVAGGAPETLIPELAENYRCDAIVMGALGQGDPVDARGLGAIALAVLEASMLPVTVVRAVTPADEAGADAAPE